MLQFFFINKEQVIRNVDDNHLQSNHFFMMSNWKFFFHILKSAPAQGYSPQPSALQKFENSEKF